MSALLTVAAMWLLPSLLILGWIKADEWLDSRWADEHESEAVTPEWLESLAIPAPRTPSDLSAGVGWARESTPIYERMCFERWEAEL